MAESSPPLAWIRAVNDIIIERRWESEPQPVKITPWLYLADYATVRNIDAGQGTGPLLEAGITHALTTDAMKDQTVEVLGRKLAAAGIQHHVVRAQDEEGYNMIENHWEECRKFSCRSLSGGTESIWTHRLIVTPALMVMEKLPVLEAVKTVNRKRGIFLTNLSFQKQLCELAQKEGLLGDKPPGYSDGAVRY